MRTTLTGLLGATLLATPALAAPPKLVIAISDIRAQTGPLAKQGLSLEDTRKKVDFTKTAGLFGATSRDKANFDSLFGDPMTENAYMEALGKPLGSDDRPQSRYTEKAPPSRAIRSSASGSSAERFPGIAKRNFTCSLSKPLCRRSELT